MGNSLQDIEVLAQVLSGDKREDDCKSTQLTLLSPWSSSHILLLHCPLRAVLLPKVFSQRGSEWHRWPVLAPTWHEVLTSARKKHTIRSHLHWKTACYWGKKKEGKSLWLFPESEVRNQCPSHCILCQINKRDSIPPVQGRKQKWKS